MGTPTKLSEFLSQIADDTGKPEAFKGAVVLVSLDRELDRLIQHALGMGPYHRGKPSWWSHTFLLGGPWIGAQTPVIEASVRSKDGDIIWDQDHADPIKILWHKDVESGICTGQVGDYDDQRVGNWGIKWLPHLASAELDAIVAAARDPKWNPYHYDFPGLLRELLRLASGGLIDPPPGKDLIFCSAFVQAVYVDALGPSGDFAPGIATADSTPDDLWYSPLGQTQGLIRR
jgi:hypothetical protein